MKRVSTQLERILRSPDLRILSVMVVSVGIFGVVDGSFWKSLVAPTIAYRPAVLFALTLLFGWRGFVWSVVLFLTAFEIFLGWRGAVFAAPMFLVSQALGFVVARQLAKNEPWLSQERSTVAFLAGAVLAPATPALLGSVLLPLTGIRVGPGVPAAVDSLLRGSAAILALGPAVLVYCSGPLKKWALAAASAEPQQPFVAPRVLEIVAEMAIWTVTLLITVELKMRYGVNVTYISFLTPLAFTLFRGMRFAALALAGNAIIATSLWTLLHWADTLSAVNLRLLLAICSLTTLVLAAVVDERQRGKGQINKLLTAEAVLRQDEEQFRILANSAPVMIWQTGPDGLCRFVNKTYQEFAGLSMEQHLGTEWLKALHPDDMAFSVAAFDSALQARRELRVVCRFRRADGEYRWILDNGVPLYLDGQFAGYIGSCIDITDEVQARERLNESEQRLKSAQQLAHVGSWHWDGATGQVFCSEECRRILGLPDDYRPTSEALSQMITPRDRERIRRELAASIAEKRECSAEFQIVRPDGELRTLTFASRVSLDEEGIPRHVFGACQDVTDMRRAQEETFAGQKMETLGTLANGIAHDFNNLLGAIVAQADLALVEAGSASNLKDELKSIQDVAMRGSEIVRELMIYAGTEGQTLVPLDVSQVIREMLELLKLSVSKHATITTELADNLPPIRANSARISQLVMNLVTNASDAIGDATGVIRIIARRVTRHEEAQGRRPSTYGDQVQIEISDTGRGMPPEVQARVFEPFFSTKSTGRGLGLAVVQGIVRSLDGRIQLDSAPGQGTTIRVSLPCAETEFKSVQAATSVAIEPARESRAETVLLVEDEHPLREAVSKLLRKAGATVIEAADGSVALDVIRDKRRFIDVLILDITIPKNSSREVFAEARSLRPEMKAFVTSAYPKDVAAASLQSPIQQFLRKPYRLGDLLGLIQCKDEAASVDIQPSR